jgi:hypothetical protein
VTELPPPPQLGRSRRWLEVTLVGLAVATGSALTATAVATRPERAVAPAASPSPTATPAPSPTEVPSPEPTTPSPVPAGPVVFSSASSEIVPIGCEAKISFEWHADRASDPPLGEVATIRVAGPGIAGTYREPLRASGVRLQFTAPLTSDSRWVATVLSAGERRAERLPLEVTAEALPFC